ncbi:MAG: TM2 domain-containing protein [Sphingopyxis sp.]
MARAEYNGDLYAFSDVRFERRDQKSILVAYLLWFFLGGVAAHRFYLGYNNSGIAMVLLLAGTLVVGIAAFLSPILYIGLILWSLWVLADAVMIPFMAR